MFGQLDNPHTDKYKPTNLFYPLTWLQESGYFGKDSAGFGCPLPLPSPSGPPVSPTAAESILAAVNSAELGDVRVSSGVALFVIALAGCIGIALGATLGVRYQKRLFTYSPLI